MTRLEALRRHALAHPATCKRLDRLYPNDEALRAVLSSPDTLARHLQAAARLSQDEVESLVAPLVTEAGDGPEPTENDTHTVRTTAFYAS